MKRAWSVMVVASLAILIPPRIVAQERPLRVGIAGGWSRDAQGNFEGSRSGLHGQMSVEWDAGALGARLDAMYNRFGSERETLVCVAVIGPCPTLHSRNEVGGISLSGLASLRGGTVRPYLIAGLGVYRFTHRREQRFETVCPGQVCAAEQSQVERNTSENFGLSGGAGVALDHSPIGVFVEARYHHLVGGGTDRGFVPVSVGIRF